jgi:Zn-dependent metalloprotease
MVERISGFAGYPEGVDVSTSISEDIALKAAVNSTGARQYLWEVPEQEAYLKTRMKDANATYYPKGSLILVTNVENATGAPTGYHLAWQFDIRETESTLDRRVFVDARTGEVIKYYPLVFDCDAGTVATTWHGSHSIKTDYDGGNNNYILLDDCQAASIHTIIEAGNMEITDGDNNWTESGVTDYATTHYYARVTEDYYQAIHSRSSYDDADGDLLLRHVANWENASYIGGGTLRVGMNTGNQGEFYNTLDVIAHEFTHAVTDNNGLGGLTYQGESGALNESFSDMLGEAAEMWFENGAYTVDWLHREDYVNGANRSFLNPNAGGQPDTYLGTNWAGTCGGCPDDGGVHTNSGVMNFWFYLVSAGGSGTNDNGDDFSVSGLGIVKTREIVYRMLTEEMTSNATYADARAAAINIAIDIYGNCSNEVKQVTNAWYAVGVGNPYCEVTLESPTFAGGYNISCNGASDGAINISMVGTGPFTVAWDDDPSTGNRSGLGAGTYGVTVTDATGCSDYKQITLTEPPVLVASATVTSDYNGYAVSCNGSSDGEATASGSGGVAPYTYAWDASAGSQTTAVATGLSAGTYSVTVTDANGCTDNTTVTLDEPPALTIEAGPNQTVYYGYPPAACATLSYSGAGGGVPPYSFLWSTGESTQNINVCPHVSTMYYITITDANNCTATDSLIVCAIDVRCGKNLDKVEICHIPPGKPGNSQTLCVAISAVPAHLAHGDLLAACGTDPTCTSLDPKSAIASSEPLHESAIMLEAYPNPFNASTTVTFLTETDGQATLKLVDSYGKVIETLYNGNVISGIPYEIELDARLYKAGFYYCKLQQSDGSTKVMKLVVNR